MQNKTYKTKNKIYEKNAASTKQSKVFKFWIPEVIRNLYQNKK